MDAAYRTSLRRTNPMLGKADGGYWEGAHPNGYPFSSWLIYKVNWVLCLISLRL